MADEPLSPAGVAFLLDFYENETAEIFKQMADRHLARQGLIKFDAQLLCRAMLRAVYSVAFERLPRDEAIKLIATALAKLNAEHSGAP